MAAEQLVVSLAYKYVALSLMLAEANHAIQQLDVPGWKPISMAEVTTYYITPPRVWIGGSLETTNYFFGFPEGGNLRYIHNSKYTKDSRIPLRERYKEWAKMKSLIDTNEAYQLATNWLTRLQVDVTALERIYPPRVQQTYYDPQDDDMPVLAQTKRILSWCLGLK